jgi:hypothetical protein
MLMWSVEVEWWTPAGKKVERRLFSGSRDHLRFDTQERGGGDGVGE